MKFSDIPQITEAKYKINVSWRSLERTLQEYEEVHNLELNPDFQRGHVWTEYQKIKYVEWILKGGQSGREIIFNCHNWASSMVCVDGLQRITAVREFLDNKIPVFGTLYKDFEDKLPREIDFIFHVGDFKERRDVLKWYIDINSGGSIHTEEEIERVRKMLEELE